METFSSHSTAYALKLKLNLTRKVVNCKNFFPQNSNKKFPTPAKLQFLLIRLQGIQSSADFFFFFNFVSNDTMALDTKKIKNCESSLIHTRIESRNAGQRWSVLPRSTKKLALLVRNVLVFFPMFLGKCKTGH